MIKSWVKVLMGNILIKLKSNHAYLAELDWA